MLCPHAGLDRKLDRQSHCARQNADRFSRPYRSSAQLRPNAARPASYNQNLDFSENGATRIGFLLNA